MTTTRVKYSGSNPGADSNDYTLFDTTVAGWAQGMTDHMHVKRCRVSALMDQAGDFELYKSDDKGTTWVLLNSTAATPGANRNMYDPVVAGLLDWKIIWENGGGAQTVWEIDIFLDTEMSAVT